MRLVSFPLTPHPYPQPSRACWCLYQPCSCPPSSCCVCPGSPPSRTTVCSRPPLKSGKRSNPNSTSTQTPTPTHSFTTCPTPTLRSPPPPLLPQRHHRLHLGCPPPRNRSFPAKIRHFAAGARARISLATRAIAVLQQGIIIDKLCTAAKALRW